MNAIPPGPGVYGSVRIVLDEETIEASMLQIGKLANQNLATLCGNEVWYYKDDAALVLNKL